jgi:hypothetical protein
MPKIVQERMKLYISQEVMEIFQIEMEQFGMKKICLIPGWAEGEEPKIWGMSDARNSAEAIAELKSRKMSLWVPQRCLGELDEQVIVRGRRGFTIGAMTDSLRSKVTLFEKNN